MVQKLIPIHDFREHIGELRQTIAGPVKTTSGQPQDARGRLLRDLRISVTDRCNFRCVYCMPKKIFDKNYAFLPQADLLSFEEITRIAKLFIDHGVEKIRLTGGEPLLRKNLEKLIEMLSVLHTVSGNPLDLTLTTNGSLLAKKAQSLKDAGLSRLTVSLDALDETIFKQMNDVDFPVSDVLKGLEAAHHVGLSNIKINMVVKSGVNDKEILPMAHHFRRTPFLLRFIEYMDVGATNGWQLDEVVSSAEIVRRIHAEMPLQEIEANYVGETARRWQYVDGVGEIGVISSVSQAFCGDCTRARISTEGRLFTCLFATAGHDLRALIRRGCSDMELSSTIAKIWHDRSDRYSEARAETTSRELGGDILSSPDTASNAKVEMSYIGG